MVRDERPLLGGGLDIRIQEKSEKDKNHCAKDISAIVRENFEKSSAFGEWLLVWNFAFVGRSSKGEFKTQPLFSPLIRIASYWLFSRVCCSYVT